MIKAIRVIGRTTLSIVSNDSGLEVYYPGVLFENAKPIPFDMAAEKAIKAYGAKYGKNVQTENPVSIPFVSYGGSVDIPDDTSR